MDSGARPKAALPSPVVRCLMACRLNTTMLPLSSDPMRCPFLQGLTLVHFPVHPEHFLWEDVNELGGFGDKTSDKTPQNSSG